MGPARLRVRSMRSRLVFGTERRGLDIPVLKPNFESNVPGIYVAGELGGMGLIKNALTQGQQALEAIAKAAVKRPGALDVLIIGAGPAGLAASLTAKKMGLNYQTVEQDSLGGAVFQYPRGKLVMTAPVELPIVGKVQFRNTSKEELLKFWEQACKGNGLNIMLPGTRGKRAEQGRRVSTSRRAHGSTSRRRYCWGSAGAARRANSACRAKNCRRSSIG
jgi:hypothetical protein